MAKTKPKPFSGHLVHVVGVDVVRVEIHDDTVTPHYTGLILSAEETMEFSRQLAKAARQAWPAPTTKRRKE